MGDTYYPMQQVVQGMLQGHQVAHMIRQEAMQQEAMARQKFQQDRNNQIQDIGLQAQLMSAGRPVDASGAVTESGNLGAIAGPTGGQARAAMPTGEGQSYEFQRKADASRRVKYKTANGETLDYELKTPEEQGQMALKAKLAEANVLGDAASARQIRDSMIDLPDGSRVRKEAIPWLTNRDSNDRAAYVADVAAQRARDLEDVKDKKARDLADITDQRQRDLQREKDDAADKRGDKNNASRERAAKLKGAGKLTPGQENVQKRFDQRELDTAEKDMTALQDKEQGHWAEAQKFQTYLDEKGRPDANGNVVDMNPVLESSWKNQRDAARKRAEGLGERQKSIRQKFGIGEFAPGGAPKPAAAAAPAAVTKKASADDLAAYVAAKGGTLAQAKAKAKAAGFQVE